MNLKLKIRAILGNLAHFKTNPSISSTRARIIERQLVRNVILNDNELSPGLRSQTPGCLLRVLACSDAHAGEIFNLLNENKDELAIRSLHIANRALDFNRKRFEDKLFTHSVIIKVDPSALLESATSPSLTDPRYLSDLMGRDSKGIQEKLVIDFSSPNIAKPFHFGHLKSTILGNYLANLNQFLGASVTRLNYIGDWGTQYGLLSLGLERFGDSERSDNQVVKSPLRHLVDVYVRANTLAQSDELFQAEAKQRFRNLDCDIKDENDTRLLEQWRHIRNLSLEELKRSYDQLGVAFNVYEYESDYANCADELLRKMDPTSLLKREDGVTVALVDKKDRQIEAPLLKSDGTSLYLTRDLAAALSRYKRYQFDRMLYVVGADQERHFHCLGELACKIERNIEKSQLIHVKMGKILGMSTRAGQFVLLSDIIAEASRQYSEATRHTVTTKTSSESEVEQVGQQLALSALFVYDMSRARTQNYEFSWDQVMDSSSWSGLNLQATHARLCNLIRKAGALDLEPAVEGQRKLDAISCVEAMNLLAELDDFDLAVHNSYWLLDASPLVCHALRLCNVVNRARQSSRLRVLDEPNERWARTKLLLFCRAKAQLELVIRLIGLRPLERV